MYLVYYHDYYDEIGIKIFNEKEEAINWISDRIKSCSYDEPLKCYRVFNCRNEFKVESFEKIISIKLSD